MAIYTYAELKAQVLRRLDEAGQTTTEDLVEDWMAAAHARICNLAPWTWMMMNKEATVATTPGQRELVLRHNLRMLMFIINEQGLPLNEITQRTLTQKGPRGMIQQGPAEGYTVFGLSPVAKQPTTS